MFRTDGAQRSFDFPPSLRNDRQRSGAVAHSTVLDDSVDFPILSGVLELQYLFVGRGIWDFVHQLSQLPLAFHTMVLEAIHISLLAPINELLATCRETLTRVDIRDRVLNYFSTFVKND